MRSFLFWHLVFKGVKNPHIFWTKYVQIYKKILLAKAKPPPFSLSKIIFLSSLLKSTQPFESWNFCKYPCLIDGNWTSSKAFLVTICKIVAIWLFKYIKTYHHSRLFWKCPIIQIRSFGVEWLPKILLQLKRLHANFMHIFWIHDDKLCIFPLHSSWNFSILHLFKSLFCWFSTTLFFLPQDCRYNISYRNLIGWEGLQACFDWLSEIDWLSFDQFVFIYIFQRVAFFLSFFFFVLETSKGSIHQRHFAKICKFALKS